ncbi:DUF1553 domain-containing protein [Zobellia galactanivorans]|uniref:DUF1553 domain-containing protein n=1 Tax=Zobellia galactanivorans (strain DSM 12802 / CCUG 47099 / CIP 106680 / NCIMB 13871 / Dsij) TaxID=63186 RepID=UPI001C067282|nr:DUF1553 domain-containing protein [Zobellia galactanivorans]
MRFLLRLILTLCLLCLSSCGWNAPEEIEEAMTRLPEKVDFNYHVKPILSDKCFACHGPDMANQKAGLRLDIAESAYEALKGSGKHPIVPHKPGESEVVARILSDDPDLKMPPAEFNVALSKNEIATLTKWIEQGAEYKPHWSFIRPQKEAAPEVKHKEWAKNDIDRFVVDRLEAMNVEPSKKAEKEHLIRRLNFDLIGLPPTLRQIEDFVNDTSANAYEKVVDRLLASPAYGERMASEWMDVARYADSDGYLDDKHRDFSPYRDWVIKAFNENMSYEQFVTWQLAGDLIKNPSQESILATAFNRLHKKNSEAGIVFEEYRVEYVADRTLSVGKAFLGLSVECARCHDHKYDPISQKDHYELFAFFNSTNEIGTPVYGPGQVPGPSLLLTNEEEKKVLEFIDRDIDQTKGQLVSVERETPEIVKTWLNNPSEVKAELEKVLGKGLQASLNFDSFAARDEKSYKVQNSGGNRQAVAVREPIIEEGLEGKAVFLGDYTTLGMPDKIGWFDQSDPFTVSVAIKPGKNYEEASIFTHCEESRQGLKGYSMHLEDNHLKFIIARSWPFNSIQLKTKDPVPEKEWHTVTVSYDGLGKAEGVHIYIDGKKVPVAIEIDNLYKSILFKKNVHNYAFGGFRLGVSGKFKSFKDGGLDNLKIYERQLSDLEVLYSLSPAKAMEEVKKNNEALLTDFYYQSIDKDAETTRKKIQELRKKQLDELEPIKEIMVLGDLPEPRPTYVLDRGMYDAPTEEVQPDVPEVVMPFNKDLPRNRLGLSQWLFDKNNPLTARVFVNRLWQMHFGQGLVSTSDDFGNQGNLPSHPELLDWLAVEFMESGWDIKKIHKLMVMSATYQQSSELTPELLEMDTDNIWLARGPSRRMTAEMVRDNALAISGLLVSKIGGPSTYPYQPEGLWDEISNKPWRYRYKQEPGEGLYRRSLYTIWKRTSAPPSMQIFDAGDRSVCAVKRRETSTPLQALVLLNDPQFIEASYILAEHLLEENNGNAEIQLQKAFQLSTGRKARQKEMAVLKRFLDEELERFLEKKEDAIAYLNMGETKIKSASDPVKVAALATVINGIMNTAEGFTIR